MGFRNTEAAEQGKGSAEGPVSAEFSPGEIRQQLGTLLRSRETKRYTSASKKEGNSSSTSANPPRFGLLSAEHTSRTGAGGPLTPWGSTFGLEGTERALLTNGEELTVKTRKAQPGTQVGVNVQTVQAEGSQRQPRRAD